MRRVPKPPLPIPSPPIRPKTSMKAGVNLWGAWLVANILGEVLEEITFFLEPVFSLLQWIVLRRYFRQVDSWVFASITGWLIVVIAFFLGGFTEILSNGLVASGFLAGLPSEIKIGTAEITTQVLVLKTLLRLIEWTLIGVCQWFILRQAYRQAYWWILIAPIAGGLRGITGVLCNQVLGGLWAIFLAPLVYGLATGVVLLLLQKRLRLPPSRIGYR